MRNVLILTVCAGCMLLSGMLLVGCFTPLHEADGKPGPSPVHPRHNPVWESLAKGIDSKRIAESDQLCGIVVRLRDAGDLTDADVQAFDAAFPHLPKVNRPLTADDATKLRGL